MFLKYLPFEKLYIAAMTSFDRWKLAINRPAKGYYIPEVYKYFNYVV